MLNRSVTSLAIVVLLCVLLVGCSQQRPQSSLERVLEDGVLKVGTNYGRTTYYNGIVGPEGFEYELAKGFADHLGVALEVYPYYSLNDLFLQLGQHHIDIIAAGISMTPERKAQFVFGPAYQDVSLKIVFLQGGERPRDVSQLNGNMLVVKGSSHAEALARAELPDTLRWQETDERDAEELLELVAQGELDYTVADSTILAVVRRRYPEISVGFTLVEEQGIGWAVNDQGDDGLRAALIEYFGNIREDGSFAILEDKYFGHVQNFDYVDTRVFIQSAQKKLPPLIPLFKQHSADIDWRLLAAMSYQESHWNPKATSPTGVRGLMMLTRATAKDMGVKSRLNPEESIRGGAQYFASLLRRVPARIQEPDKIWLAMAAYNIGLGHLEDARVLTQRFGGNPDLWIDVKQHLPKLRQKRYYSTTKYGYARGNEAVDYVENIRRYYDTLLWLDEQQSFSIAPPELNN
ncbi:membrane-bound lytic murein transglycosylase MltF [Alteromonas oceanisediminis]|uniref:membrane-bound lytic murein transglycosylase MltF n=1 Tax=Alteromonas oceanisediminis TaxID=2836180 RepID=UPI001BDA7F99|nr:membrane-bound lytic murein transglycosylase MltF [Alteromonas oceanisediminis]MBT0584992.1 membrane-bound lytic murein transglycosylase MltF [Alteromonas oceanisediminis]